MAANLPVPAVGDFWGPAAKAATAAKTPTPKPTPPRKGQPNTTFAGKHDSSVSDFVGTAANTIKDRVVHPTHVVDDALGLLSGTRQQAKFAYEHPIARLQNKGPFQPTKFVTVNGKRVPLNAGTIPFFGGPKGEFDLKPEKGVSTGGFTKAPKKGPVQTVNTLGEAVTAGLKGARGLRAEQETLRSPERGARAQAFGKELQANPTAAGAEAASAQLAGKYPKVSFAGFSEFSPEAHDAMVKAVADHPDLRGFEQKRAVDALAKVRDGVLPTKSDEKLLRQVFGPDTTKQMMTSVSRFKQLKALGYDVANIPRSVMASFDASGILRQALMVATGHPGIWAKNVPAYFKAIKSEQVYNAGIEALHNRPNAVDGVYEKMGVDLTEMSPRGATASREEAFRSPLAERIPVVGRGVRMSGRGYVLFLDNARADLADYMYAKAQRLGRDVNDPHLLQSIGDVVNSASGRGELPGVLGRSQEGLNILLFSPRLIKSRIDFINPFWYKSLDPLARHQAYRALGGLVVLVATADAIANAAGAKVKLDPRSSDFAKIKIGNTRIDLAGGFLQYIRFLSEIATQQVVTASGQTKNLKQEGPGNTSDWDVIFRFIRSKLAPLSSLSVDASQRQNTIGQPLTWQNSLLSRVTPLSGQDAFSVGQDVGKTTGSTTAGVLAGVGAFGLSSIGGGVQNYQPKQPKQQGGGSSFWNTPSPSSGNSNSSFWGK